MSYALRFFTLIFALFLFLTGCLVDRAPAPIPSARNRPVALTFGMHVTTDAKENPIDPPERFDGYHAGLDYEVSASELDEEIPISAICSGSVLYSGFAEGYGGVLTQRCNISDASVTVIYGHLDGDGLASEGTILAAGDRLGKLAPARSFWSDLNRKHLHLGIHKGEVPDMRGYVQEPMELEEFIDPRAVLPRGAGGRQVSVYRVPEEAK
ncbi:hypothetical protein A3C37_03725 [Candidatus Peribacteria bacterium RIFCSPHIGHO2_02_FULL_53_20]|nr:MAG: hypothetical protein A3C37_03725 [Candidatus Peribacteria bacterium RIFCSPHIGHO2_02_FULL_53_20]OGJ67154.1 MAG: hypothetical protein A3B61_02915 [Candidatus Peribacteria bacterium RIFCSPLOWO2_01_FULL_53_10]OGJ75059.1 MAG: hypothetical protein A3G69_05475 [Candidatus Peribacteria bacterium RIFCSPLOWO2_12_FULL_53_10]